MADDIFLTGPLGTQWNIGSWVEKSAGVDFGAAQLVRQIYGQNAWAEGARLGFETAAGPRRMTFPLIVPSGGVAGLSLDAIEASLRQMVRPGGFADLKLDGVPTAEMVRFDILGGDVAHRNYTVDVQRIDRRRFALSLDTQPFGYWPTWITLASAASVGLPGQLAIPAASIIGDVPAFALIEALPSTPTNNPGLGGTWLTDTLMWSVGARPSFQAFLAGASFVGALVGGTPIADTVGPVATSWRVFVNGQQNFNYAAIYKIASAIEPAYRGRYQAFMLARFSPSQTLPFLMSLDVAHDGNDLAALASAAPVATLPAGETATAMTWAAHHLLDMGQVTIPLSASGIQQEARLRVWTSNATTAITASSTVDIAGIYLLPLGGPAGVLPRGLAQPTNNASTVLGFSMPHVDKFQLDSFTGRAELLNTTTGAPDGDAQRFYRGQLPLLGATVVQMDLMGAARRLGASDFPIHTQPHFTSASIRYRPRFQFLKGI